MQKAETKEKRKKKSFRNELDAMLADFKADIAELGEDEFCSPTFSPGLDADSAPQLSKLFSMSGLNSKKPRHWQLLLVAVSNAIHQEDAGRPTVWTTQLKDRLFREGCKIKKVEPEITVLSICKRLKVKNRHFSKFDPESLRFIFHRVLREKRREAELGKTTEITRKHVGLFGRSKA